MIKKISFQFAFLLIILAGIIFLQMYVQATSSNENLSEKLGQLFIIGIEAANVDKKTEALIRRIKPGGVLLLGKNIESKEQLKKLIADLQQISLQETGMPLFIAIDQEGGPVSRLPWAESTSQKDINSQTQAYAIAFNRGAELKEMGINLNLSPLLDAVQLGDFIYERAFEIPEKSGLLAGAMVEGQGEAGILSAVKHYPGYTGIPFNPEDRLATVERLPETAQFKTAMISKPAMLMISNVIYSSVDRLPFSFSRPAIAFMKTNLPGDYLLISDDLSQSSLLNQFTLSETVVMPFNAGIDVLIVSGWKESPEKTIEAFQEAFRGGQVSKDRISESLEKIALTKKNFLAAP